MQLPMEQRHSMDRTHSDLEAELIRGVPLNVCLSGFGRHFNNRNGNMFSNIQDKYSVSQKTNNIDDFLSHDWETKRRDKFLALAWTFNLRAAVLANFVASCLVGLVRSCMPWPGHWSLIIIPYLIFFFFLFGWQEMRSKVWGCRLVFLDCLCIPQHDENLKRRGIMGLSSFLKHSQRLCILWSPRWITRLWCVYELAAFMKYNKMVETTKTADPTVASKRKEMQLLPVKLSSVLLLQCFCWTLLSFSYMVMLELSQHETEGFDDEYGHQQQIITLVILVCLFAAVVILILPTVVSLGLEMTQELLKLPASLREFRVEDVKCFCCSNDHKHPLSGETLPCDREKVYFTLRKWFSEGVEEDPEATVLERFNILVQQQLSTVMSQMTGIGTQSTACGLPVWDAWYAMLGANVPWLSDFIPWWINGSDFPLGSVPWFLWFLRGVMLISYNGFVMLYMMYVCDRLWHFAVLYFPGVSRRRGPAQKLLVTIQVLVMLIVALIIWVSFRWVYVSTDDTNLLPGVIWLALIFLNLWAFGCYPTIGQCWKSSASKSQDADVRKAYEHSHGVHGVCLERKMDGPNELNELSDLASCYGPVDDPESSTSSPVSRQMEELFDIEAMQMVEEASHASENTMCEVIL